MWIRLPGKSRNYIETETGNKLSRRQYDKQYGRLLGQGFTSYERKAKANREADIERYLARPARGRKSVLKAPQAERKAALAERMAEHMERAHKKRVPQSVTNRMLPKGKRGIRVSLPFNLDIMFAWLNAGSKNPAIIAAGVGVEGVRLTDNTPIHATAYGAFLLNDYRRNPDGLKTRITNAIGTFIDDRASYLTVTGLFVWFTWSIVWLRTYRNWKG